MIGLGDYELGERVASGGMAEVWSATHVPTESQVAVKLAIDHDPRLASAIHAEATAMAMLRSPRVVRIHEVGVVSPSQHQSSGGKLRDGAPWIAMEWLPGGTLAEVDRVRSWPDLQFALLDVLQALAHAHAHGLVHRDVKPANVLVEREGPLRVKLADFGITFARRRFLEGRADAPTTALTPMFAAPEQLGPHLVRQGPWTDLYQLGSLAWSLVSGGPPFGSVADPRAAARGHLKAPVPPLRPRFQVPPELQGWVERLMEKQPADRFPTAADAAEALRALDPMPAAQRRAAPPAVGQRIVGAALASLRTPQLVGRAAELAALRAAAERVRSTGVPRIVLVRGPAGVGTTALVGSATLTAEERGEIVCVRAGETTGASGGLAQLCSAALGEASGDVDRIELALQSRPAVPPFREPLSALLEQRLEDRAERFEVTAELLKWRADRLLVLWIDPPHGGGELVPFAEWLRMTRKVPALVVISAADEHLAEHPQVVAAADQVIALGPLEPPAMLELVADLGTVDTATAARIAARSAGQPAVAVELVRDLLLKGAVADEPVLQGIDGPLPDRDRWEARRQGVAAAYPGAVPALEVAAALG
ncbi:MAG: serine/threonine-protein kinase, partial [Myxococcota bacterium]